MVRQDRESRMSLSGKTPILLTCPRGLAPFLADEVRALGFDADPLEAGVLTKGTLSDCMYFNLHLRTAHRVMREVWRGKAYDSDALYKAARALPWDSWFQPDAPFTVSSSVRNETVRDTRYPNLKLKDAIADRFREVTGERPDSGRERDGASVFLHWRGNSATIYLDTSGEPLAKRGYRLEPHRAPMQETLAAGVLLALGYDAEEPLVNPMCGSGTLAVEAALMSTRTAPGLLRESFAFRHLQGFDEAAWKAMRTDARRAMRTAPAPIIATDLDTRAVAATLANADRAGMAEAIAVTSCDFRSTPLPPASSGKGGFVVMNPEYGERLGLEDKLAALYPAMGDWLKQSCQGWTAGIFTGNPDLAKRIGLRPSRRVPFWNAKIECRLLVFEMYAGSRAG